MSSFDFNREDYLSPAELVERWRATPFPVSLVTLARWRRIRRDPQFIKAGHNGRVYYPLEAIRAYESTIVSSPSNA